MDHNPFTRFGEWLKEAEAGEPNDPNAMALATVGADGSPAVRMVLLKGWDARGFVFYTNLESRKAEEIQQNPKVSLLFHWKSLRRQIRIEGVATPASVAEADAYFATRSRASQLGAWASAQSRPMASREIFERKLVEVERRFGDGNVPRPENWSGWRVTPDYFEFWEDRAFRLHERLIFSCEGEAWETGLLYP